jgi:hypothetical protein
MGSSCKLALDVVCVVSASLAQPKRLLPGVPGNPRQLKDTAGKVSSRNREAYSHCSLAYCAGIRVLFKAVPQHSQRVCD